MATSRRHLRDRVIGAGIARGSLASPAEFRNGSLQERARLEEPDLARLSQAASRQHSSMDSQRAKARALEAEITALRRACIETQAPGDDDSQVRKSFQETHQSDSEEWGLSKDLRSHLGSLESELQFLSRLTGISIRNYCKNTEDLTSTEMAEKSIKKVLQRHRLSGNCHMITFQLEYQILEIQDKESLSSVITDLSIIMEPTEYSELSEFVSRIQHFPVDGCSAASGNFGVLAGEDERTSFYSAILKLSKYIFKRNVCTCIFRNVHKTITALIILQFVHLSDHCTSYVVLCQLYLNKLEK
ncbi:centromere protein P isoform X3 [Bubalus kerabau]|uniref:centromere protein P isoform X3 n=1 Tax=Bubalus carabanensis TaxID=3119969 RepID=UPI00244E9A9F|nr:centromere protein P isoform X3 [Bubalus carabanensis]